MDEQIKNRWALMEYLNRSKMESTYDLLAKYVYENHLLLSGTNITHIAKETNTSQSTVSRFFRDAMRISINDYISENNVAHLLCSQSYCELTEKNDEFNGIDNLSRALNEMHQISNKTLLDMCKLLRSYQNILFLASQFTIGEIYPLQALLVYDNKNVYVPMCSTAQEVLLDMAEKDTLVILVFLGQKLGAITTTFETIYRKLKRTSAELVLWKGDFRMNQEDRYRKVIKVSFSERYSNFQLQVFIQLLRDTYLKKYIKPMKV